MSRDENQLSFVTRGLIFKVYNALGPGLLESVYENVLKHELVYAGLLVEQQVPVPLVYNDVKLDIGFRIDLLIEHKLIVEIKSVEAIHEVHHKQVLTYLRLTQKRLGLLVNFHTNDIAQSIYRKVNGL